MLGKLEGAQRHRQILVRLVTSDEEQLGVRRGPVGLHSKQRSVDAVADNDDLGAVAPKGGLNLGGRVLRHGEHEPTTAQLAQDSSAKIPISKGRRDRPVEEVQVVHRHDAATFPAERWSEARAEEDPSPCPEGRKPGGHLDLTARPCLVQAADKLTTVTAHQWQYIRREPTDSPGDPTRIDVHVIGKQHAGHRRMIMAHGAWPGTGRAQIGAA